MSLVKKTAIIFLLVLMVCGKSNGDQVYTVGDSAGWTNADRNVNYRYWAAAKTFQVGDTILFEYNIQFQDVVRVTHKNFNTCNATTPYAKFTTGNDSFVIKYPGHYYFICSVPGHCEAGQKVDIRVLEAPSPTSPPPSSSPPVSSPSPSESWPYPPSPANQPDAQNTSTASFSSNHKFGLSILVLASLVLGIGF